MIDLTSPTEDDDKIENNNDILFVKEKEVQQEGETEKANKNLQEDEEHESNGEEANKKEKQTEMQRI